MYWTWPQLLAHASRDATLRPGDVLGSGTVGGGCILELTPEAVGGWLQPGDLVELTVERLGTLSNRVVNHPKIHEPRMNADQHGSNTINPC
jgi:fumarylacetoacetate (FAA) hydrolase